MCGYQVTATECSRPGIAGRQPMACAACNSGTAQNYMARLAAAEAAGDSEALAVLWLELQGLEWIDSIDELAADTTPPDVAAARIREALAEMF